MELDVLKDCKKYVIQEIYDPASYLIAESENRNYYENEMRWLEHSLASNMKECVDAKQFRIGKLVAVKNKKDFQVGRIDDIYKRYGETKYLILLIDSGKTVETDRESIYLLNNQQLKDEIKNAFKIFLHDVQPVALDINDKNPALCGIFQLRACSNWSPAAFEFVKNLFVYNPNIFFKIIKAYDESVSGEIYFIEDSDAKPVSLSQKLCDEGFAVFCGTTLNSSNNYNQTGNYTREIEEKIPANAFSSGVELHKTLSELNIANESVSERKNLRIENDETMSSQQLSYHMKNDSRSTSTENIDSKCSKLGSFKSKANKYSSGSNENPISSKSPSNSIKTSSNEVKSESVENNKQNICRIVLRNLKLFNQEKHIREKCSQK